jgi:hypothetical protein
MQCEDFDSGTEPKRKNAERTMNTTIAASQDISQHDALRRNQTSTAEHTEQQRLRMKKNNRKSSQEKRHLSVKHQILLTHFSLVGNAIRFLTALQWGLALGSDPSD